MKLWEALKELEENPKKVFKSSLAGVEYKISLDGEVTAFEASTGKYTGLNNSREWQEVKQPVPWQEAIEAWVNGKTIRWEDREEVVIISGFQQLLEDVNGPLAKYQITSGTWYIED